MRGAGDCARRLRTLLLVVCVAFAAGIALSYRLWISDRTYPLAPVTDWLGPLPRPWDWLVLGVVLAALLAGALAASRAVLLGALTLLGLLALQDQTRWQPWAYQYAAMLVALALALSADRGDRQGRARCEASLFACRAIVTGIYFWSGLQKLNASFLETGLAALVDERTLAAPMRQTLVVAGAFVPVLEASIGVGLLWQRSRRLAVAGAVVMHAAILLLIGPFARPWNPVVWPWNVAMCAFVVVLFREADGPALRGTRGRLSLDRRLDQTAFDVTGSSTRPARTRWCRWSRSP